MLEPTAASIFGSVNARNLTPYEVAQTFIPPPSFERLLKHSNAVVVGPRGSGKTTLLKMLHQDALESWTHPDADGLLSDLRFVAVFVPTDYRWARQLQLLGEGRLPPDLTERMAVSAYTTHALRSLCSTMLGRTRPPSDNPARLHARVQLPDGAEERIAIDLAAAWNVPLEIPSFLALRHGLSKRLHDIRWAANRLRPGDDGDKNLDDLPFLDMPFLESIALGIERFNDAADERGRHWALALDELEFAPPTVLRDLLRALRGAEDALLFKLALAPASGETQELEAHLAAAPEHDFEPVQLWYQDRVDGEAFCNVLWDRIATARGWTNLSADDVLGDSYFEPRPGPTGDDYEKGSKWAHFFARVAKKDDTFGEYLKKRHIEPAALDKVKGRQKASDIRKIAPLLPLRDFYRAPDGGKRSRKRASLYAGAKSFFAISEGNPRWFIALANRLLDRYDGTRLREGVQAQEIEATSQRFSAYLRTLPAPTVRHRGADRGVLGVVSTIAEAIHDEHVKGAFRPEPPATFSIPAQLPEDLVEILTVALNAGAIIYIPDDTSQLLVRDLRGKRFRVSYLLAPLFGLPLRLGKTMSLKKVFSRRSLSEQSELDLTGEHQ